MLGQNEECTEMAQSLEQPTLTERIRRDKMKLEEQLTDLNRLNELFKANPDLQEALAIMLRTQQGGEKCAKN